MAAPIAAMAARDNSRAHHTLYKYIASGAELSCGYTMHASKGRKYYACSEKRSQKRREIIVTITRRDLCRLALLSLMVAFDGRSYTQAPHDSQSMPRTCWACDPEAPTTPWPVLHLIARHHTHPTTHLPPQAYAWVAPWFHRTDTNPTVAWNPDHALKRIFTTTPTWPRPNPAVVAIRYSMYEPGRIGKHEHPYYPLYNSCHTPEHRPQILTCHDLAPDTAYILHYIYSYLTQGQPEQGLIAMSPQAKHILSKGIGVYATSIL